ncbi:unnamed protein product [Menidia menidia]|uniref:(Atlantic silverside) hypothetical protein n=1 Tax=Menidia menidia TaxID=238744 RepID=A0A8S4BSH9_9TELE|nr:unnamed protein product [Menidia menidia]
MKRFLAPLCLLGSLLQATEPCAGPTSEFQLKGDYLLGGLFDIHHFSTPYHQERPEAMHCSSKPFLLPHYRWFELMRFSVEEINNSTSLLPNVSLGYEIFDHCSDAQNFPDVFKLISANGLIQPWSDPQRNQSELIGVVGPFTSSQVQTVAPLFMEGLIPVVSYGGTASIFSKKSQYPSFLRTVHPNKETLNVIVDIILHFNWRWVAFLNSDSDFGIDGLELFRKMILDTEICLAYTKSLDENVNYSRMFKQIEAQKVDTIIVFASRMQAEAVIESAIQLNVTNKVWMADEGWSLNTRLPKMQGIRNIGTVIGVSQPVVTIPGFSDFIYSTKNQPPCEDLEQQTFCNQICNCSDLSAEDILDSDPSFSFHVYSAALGQFVEKNRVAPGQQGVVSRELGKELVVVPGPGRNLHTEPAFLVQ